jgi:mono/diheme cytochrome c family protein
MQALLFIFIWVVLALVVFLAAFHVTRDSDTPVKFAGSMPGGFKLVITLAAAFLLLGVPALVIGKTTDRMPTGAGVYSVEATTANIDGRNIFRSTCASCHALSAANARGVYGPDLDAALGAPGADPKATAARVEGAIKTGGATGKQMPKDLLSGTDAKLVSDYIAAVAGK